MFHSGFAAPQCLSFWYPSSNDYSRKQKYQYIKKINMLLLHHDLPHSALAISCWVPSPLTVLMALSYFMAYGQRLFRPGYSGPVGAQIPAQRKTFCKLYVCLPESNRLLSFFDAECMLDICSEIGFALTHVCKWTMGQCVLNKILFLSPDIIEWRKMQDLKKEQSSWSATYCK